MSVANRPKRSSSLDRRIAYYPHPAVKQMIDILSYCKMTSLSEETSELVNGELDRLTYQEKEELFSKRLSKSDLTETLLKRAIARLPEKEIKVLQARYAHISTI